MEGSVDLIQMRKLDLQLERRRRAKRHVMSRLHAYRDITAVHLHDADGEIARNLGFFANSGEEAVRVSETLRAEGLSVGTRGQNPRPDWHYFESMEPITSRTSATSDGQPWNLDAAAEVDYSPEACPRSVDLSTRLVRVSIDQWWTENDCKQAAGALTKVFDALYQRDPAFDDWTAAATCRPD